MKNPVCEELLIYQATRTEDENFRSWFIVNCVFNSLLTITTIIFNSVSIQALRKTSSLPMPLKTLLLSLAVSDLGVGLLVEPFYIGLLIKWLQRDISADATCTHVLLDHGPLFWSFICRRYGSKCRQILGDSSSSKIPGTGDSQASCCFGDLNMDIQCTSFLS